MDIVVKMLLIVVKAFKVLFKVVVIVIISIKGFIVLL